MGSDLEIIKEKGLKAWKEVEKERFVFEKSFIDWNEDTREDVLFLLLQKKRPEATEKLVNEITMFKKFYTIRSDIQTEIYIYYDGIYIPQGKCFIKEFVRGILGQAFTNQICNEVISKIEADTFVDKEKFFSINYLEEIPVENGILNLKTRKLIGFSPDKIFFSKLPVKFDPKAICPKIDKFLSDVLADEEDRKVFYELIGYCLYKDSFLEKSFMFHGDGRNGKGKTLELIKRFFGLENCCNIPLEDLRKDNFDLCQLFGKLVNIAGDLNNTSLKETGMFKMITGRDFIQVKRKFKEPIKFTNYSKQIFACNELPRVYDFTKGFWSRWCMFNFPYEFLAEKEIKKLSKEERQNKKIKDPTILSKIISDEELSGLLNKALDGLQVILKNNDFSTSKGTQELKDTWVRKSDSFMAFCLDYVQEDIESYISKKQLRAMFNKYCKMHKVKGTSDNSIKATLQEMFGVVDNKSTLIDNREWVWEGIKFKDSVKDVKGFQLYLGNSISYTKSKSIDTLDNQELNNIPTEKIT